MSDVSYPDLRMNDVNFAESPYFTMIVRISRYDFKPQKFEDLHPFLPQFTV